MVHQPGTPRHLKLGEKQNWFQKLHLKGKESREWKYVVGTRRTVLENEKRWLLWN